MPNPKLAGPEDFRACARSAMSAAIRELVSAYTFATHGGMPDATCIHMEPMTIHTKLREDLLKYTDEGLECSNCPWRGVEENAVRDDNEDDPGFMCPDCGEPCAHVPMDEQLTVEEIDEWLRILQERPA
jgi:hypothetical protein